MKGEYKSFSVDVIFSRKTKQIHFTLSLLWSCIFKAKWLVWSRQFSHLSVCKSRETRQNPTLLDENSLSSCLSKITFNWSTDLSNKFLSDPIIIAEPLSYALAHLDSVPGLGGDPLHGQDDLECVLRDVPGAHAEWWWSKVFCLSYLKHYHLYRGDFSSILWLTTTGQNIWKKSWEPSISTPKSMETKWYGISCNIYVFISGAVSVFTSQLWHLSVFYNRLSPNCITFSLIVYFNGTKRGRIRTTWKLADDLNSIW